MASSSGNQSTSYNQSQNASQGTSASQSGSFIPNYSQTPILESIAQYAENMAPQIYEWGMNVYDKNQGNIDDLMRTAETYASGQRLAADIGMAEAGVQQAGERAMENSKRDLESYGIDPSSGRYAALDQASRVQTAAAAAGAGNQQRNADIATSNAMKNQAISAGMQNAQTGLGAANAANAFLSTGIKLPYSPLGTQSASASQQSSYGQSQGASQSSGSSSTSDPAGGGGGGGSKGGGGQKQPQQGGGGSPGGGGGSRGGGGGYPGGSSGGGGFGGGGYGGDPYQDPYDNTGGFDPVYDPGGIYGSGGEGNPYPVYDPGESGLPGSGGGDGGVWGEGWDPTTTGPGDTNWGDNPLGGGSDYGGDWNTGGGDEGSAYAKGGPVDPDQDQDQDVLGGYDPDMDGPQVPSGMSPSAGQAVDDVPAKLTAGEFVMPDDVVRWKGEEFFQTLIEKARVARQSVMQAHGQMQGQQGMNMGGAI